jgi:hypothetical protein
MPSLKTYDLFVSHAWTYGDEYTRLITLLNSANNFQYRNYSAPQDRPIAPLGQRLEKKDLISAINNKIRQVNAFLLLSGMYIKHREWIQNEIDFALNYRKPIISIVPWGQERVPREIEVFSSATVRWNTDSIVGAIRQHAI